MRRVYVRYATPLGTVAGQFIFFPICYIPQKGKACISHDDDIY